MCASEWVTFLIKTHFFVATNSITIHDGHDRTAKRVFSTLGEGIFKLFRAKSLWCQLVGLVIMDLSRSG
uniref:Putative secreted protein n=1 Tax=Anopheles marajoara TaxID=58244 RepID=A0A2M4CF47_9DIPT